MNFEPNEGTPLMRTVRVQREELKNADKLWHLRQAALMEGLTSMDLEVIASICLDRIYQAGEVIFHQGEPVDFLFILNRGYVRISGGNAHQKEKIVSILKMGNVFGEEVLGLQECRQISATAHEECWVSMISQKNLFQLLEKIPVLSLNFIRILNQQLYHAHDDLQDLSFLDIQYRVAKTLLKLGNIHGATMPSRGNIIKLKIRITHEHLASLVGANRAHLSMLMSRFKTQGWLSYQGQQLLLNVDELERFIGSKCDDATSSYKIGDSKTESDTSQPRSSDVLALRQKIVSLM